jgi:hypothetical protein
MRFKTNNIFTGFLSSLVILFLFFSCAPKEIQPPRKQPTLLWFSARGRQGFAHIGVLKVLRQIKSLFT